MNKRKLLAVLLAGVLAVCAVALAGCGSNAGKVKAAFEADPYVTEFDLDSDYLVDSPYAVTEFEIVNEGKNDGVTTIDFTATLENDSLKASVMGVALAGEDNTCIFQVYDSPIVTAKKGIDFLNSEDELLSADAGYTVSFDEASQSCVVTADKADAHDFGLGTLYTTGKQEFVFDNGKWRITGDSKISHAMDWNTDVIEGTYKLDTKEPDTPETVVISNVQADPESLLGATFTVEYSFDGVDVKNEGTLKAHQEGDGSTIDYFRVSATGEYPPVNDDVDFIRASMQGDMVFEDGKVYMEDVSLRSEESVREGTVFRVGNEDPFDFGKFDLVYVKQ